jgi:hypothetical protein
MGAASDEELSEDAEDEDDEGAEEEEEEEEEEQEEVIPETQVDPDMMQLDPSLDLRARRAEFARLQQQQGITFSGQAVQQPLPLQQQQPPSQQQQQPQPQQQQQPQQQLQQQQQPQS